MFLSFFSEFPPFFLRPTFHISHRGYEHIYNAWVVSLLCNPAKVTIHLIWIFPYQFYWFIHS